MSAWTRADEEQCFLLSSNKKYKVRLTCNLAYCHRNLNYLEQLLWLLVIIMYLGLPADTLNGHRERFYSHFAEYVKLLQRFCNFLTEYFISKFPQFDFLTYQ